MLSTTTTRTREYEYRPLLDNEIRILELLPGSNSDSISCRLIHTSLDGSPNYEAVSYTWGSEPHDHFIYIDGKEKQVTHTVTNMLREFRTDILTTTWSSELDSLTKELENLMNPIKRTPLSPQKRSVDMEMILAASSHRDVKVEELTVAAVGRASELVRESKPAAKSYWHEAVLRGIKPESRFIAEALLFNDTSSDWLPSKETFARISAKSEYRNDSLAIEKHIRDFSFIRDHMDQSWGPKEQYCDSAKATQENLPVGESTHNPSLAADKPNAHSSPRYIWIDTLCIDQTNPEERSKQVLLMRQIYAQAEGLLVWLGDEDEWSNIAISSISAFANKYKEGMEMEERGAGLAASVSPMDGRGNAKAASEIVDDWVKEIYGSDFLPIAWHSLALWFSRPWFTRGWIIQEYTLGPSDRSELFYCGSGRASGQDMQYFHSANAARIFNNFSSSQADRIQALEVEVCRPSKLRNPVSAHESDLHRRYFDIFKPTVAIIHGAMVSSFAEGTTRWRSLCISRQTHLLEPEEFRTMRMEAEPFYTMNALLPWLIWNRQSMTTDPRDKIYSVLGLALNSKEPVADLDFDPDLLVMDYTRSTQDVYASLVRSVVGKTGSLDILAGCTTRGDEVSSTWVPDWTQKTGRGLLEMYLGVPEKYPFNAAEGFAATATFSDDLAILTVQGITWDRIDVVSVPYPLDDDPKFKTRCNSVLETMAKQGFDTSQGAKESLWRTLVLARERRSVQWGSFSSELEAAFDVWLNGAQKYLRVETFRHPDGREAIAITPTAVQPPGQQKLVDEMDAAIKSSLQFGHRLILTENGYFGQGHTDTKVGDVVCVILGCASPMILRPVEGERHYELVGEAYVDKIMRGEAIEALKDGKVELRDFDLH